MSMMAGIGMKKFEIQKKKFKPDRSHSHDVVMSTGAVTIISYIEIKERCNWWDQEHSTICVI